MHALELIRSDHRTVDALFAQYEATPSTETRKEIVQKVIRELSVHAAVEEQLFYPAVRRADEGDRLADHAIDEHHEIKQDLADLEDLDPADAEYDRKVRALMADVREHVAEEEGQLFPAIRSVVSEERLEQIGSLMEQAKNLVPTHPHPLVPGTATAQLLAGPWAAIADRIRDAVGSATGR